MDLSEIGGVRVNTTWYPFWFDHMASAASGVRGQFLGDDGKVLLDPDLPPHVLVSTVVHEAVHAMFDGSPLTSGKDKQVDSDLEELIAVEMERGFVDFIRSNRAFINLLLKDTYE